MVVNILLSIMAGFCFWNAHSLYAATSQFYRNMPLAHVPGAVNAITHRVVVGFALSLGLAYRIWG